MEIIQLFIAADCVHVRVEPFPQMKVVFLEREALPLCERLNNLSLCSGILDVEGDLSLIPVQVVVQTGGCLKKERCADAVQLKRRC